MGIFKAAFSSADSLMEDQWKEYFYCSALPDETMIRRGQRLQTERGGNEASADVISDGSLIVVADGTSAVVTENGKVIACYTEPGENVFETDRVPSIFNKRENRGFFNAFKERVAFGGDLPVVHRVYYINTREIPGIPFSVEGVPFRIRDPKAGADLDGSVRCAGMFSVRVTDPGLFYKVAHINRNGETSRSALSQVMQAQLTDAFHTAIGALAAEGLRPSQLALHTAELCSALNEAMRSGWAGERGLSVVSVALSSLTVMDSAMNVLHQMQDEARLTDPTRMAAHLGSAAADAMQAAAENPSAGPAVMAAAMPAPAAAPAAVWTCSCGAENRGKFCTECGSPRPADWVCTCGAHNQGNFCTECGRKRP